MVSSFLITFREALEAALIVGIILSYLGRIHQEKHHKVVYLGVMSGVVASILGALLFVRLAGGFTGRGEQVFEGVTMFLGAVLLTTMIIWMMKQKQVAAELEHRIAREVAKARKFSLFLLVFVSILREGIETVIFLGAASFVSTDNNLIGALAGMIAAIVLGYAVYLGTMRISLKKFFNITSILLIFFAAGLVAYGVHEFQEAKILPTIIEKVWDINPPVNPDGSYPLLHEKGYIGSILKGLFGYNGDPSLLEVVSYFAYLLIAYVLWRRTNKGVSSSLQKKAEAGNDGSAQP